MKKNGTSGESAETLADTRLQQLLHLKRYEAPDPSRMVRNKQNIMRMVRETNARQHWWNLGDLLEAKMPWLFAEPRYGIAALFIIFAALQYAGVSSRQQARTGIYTAPAPKMATYKPSASVRTNQFAYPELPSNIALFPNQRNDDNIKFVGRIEER